MRGVENNVGCAPISRLRGNQMACFDRLPAPMRHALWEGVVDWDARECRWDINKLVRQGMKLTEAVAREVSRLRAYDVREVQAFAHHWPSRFGKHPHTAAQATIQRYGRITPRAVPPQPG